VEVSRVNPVERVSNAVVDHSKVVIVVLLLATVGVGAGAVQVEQSSDLGQFSSDSPEAEALDYAQNFTGAQDDTTVVQVIVRNESGNVLSRASLVRSLRYQQALRANETVNATLAQNRSVFGVSNAVAVAAIRTDQARNLSTRARRLQERNATLAADRRELAADRRALEARSDRLNDTARTLATALTRVRVLQGQYDALNDSLAAGAVSQTEYARSSRRVEAGIASAVENGTTALSDSGDAAAFRRNVSRVRSLKSRADGLNESFAAGNLDRTDYERELSEIQEDIGATVRAGSRGVLSAEFARLRADSRALRERGQRLQTRGEELGAAFEELQADQRALRNASTPTLDEQVEALASRNATEVEDLVATVLGDGEDGNATGGQGAVFRLMPTDYEPGTTTASARSMLVTQQTGGSSAVQNPSGVDEPITDAQLAMEALRPGGEEYLVFGGGIISDELSRSQSESLRLIGPLALLFVLVALLVAYRDLVDILLGLVGIGAVLALTFGAMGWAGIAFNQILISVPALLIGLSIDYAIHTFMRHREQREELDEGPRRSMRVALAGVGVALVWVTATAVIGFMSNLISPIGPIQDFGIVSAIGITATLVVFGGLVPALKVELDELFEAIDRRLAGGDRGAVGGALYGLARVLVLDRKKPAFGTGGGRLGSALSVGAWGARRAPAVVIVLALLITAAGAAGGSQVETSFQQEDFLAEDPPGWMDNLPAAVRPSDYTAKQNLQFVNDNFQREDSEAQVLVRGPVATADALDRIDAARERAAGDDDVTVVLSNGEASIDSPPDLIRETAAENESFAAFVAARDDDGDGLPDTEVAAVYDRLFRTTDEAGTVLRTEDGEYVAARLVVSVQGGATTAEVTEAARGWADQAGGEDLSATATGSPVVNEVVQANLLDTVIESLVVSILAVFAFLIVAYRLTEGSASLGAITLLPVALNVAWILGTMYVADIPFNVITGTITSLTIGLGVAYNVHVSERYNLELERGRGVDGALEKAVTGTGGALLGSAATTVGGFGTLAIAIFPALQQFGIITGITIVYAFLASVLVLPSLLVVWTKYAGPDPDEFVDDTGDDATGGASTPFEGGPTAADATDGDATGDDGSTPAATEDAGNGTTAAGGTTAVDGPAGDGSTPATADDRAGDATTAPDAVGTNSSAADDVTAVATGPTGDADPGREAPARSVDPTHPQPGETFTVTVRVPEVDGRALLVEEVPSVGGQVDRIAPEPDSYARVGQSLYVLWETAAPTDLVVEYHLTVPEDAGPQRSLAFEGEVRTATGTVEVGGATDAVVATPFLREALDREAITPADLDRARERAQEGAVSQAELELLYDAWLAEPAEAPGSTGRTDGGDGGD
jgi:predicted RND superfamily exporter protein